MFEDAFIAKYRVFPRVFSVFYLSIMYECAQWFMFLPNSTTAQSNFVIAVFGAGAAWFKFYVDSGNSKK